MREHLLGYLLDDLEPGESKQVAEALASDERLQRDLELLRQCLAPLAADAGHLTPPEGLALRTCRLVAAHAESTTVRVASSASRGWRFSDMAVAAGVLVAASMVFFPAVNHSRMNAQLAGCQYNLRNIGLAMFKHSDAHGGAFPQLETSGKTAVAGYYGPMLRQAGYLDNDTTLVCPTSPLAQDKDFRTPTKEEIERSDGEALRRLQDMMGGSYGYNLGLKLHGKYQGVQDRNRASFALMSDAPRLQSSGSQANSDNHGGRGQNVLFEDGHVRYLNSCKECESSDDYFHNAAGHVAPGVHIDDAVIGHSATPPLGWPSKR